MGGSPITTEGVIEVLTPLFGEGYEFQQEPISGGGIIMTKWPGKEKGCDESTNIINVISILFGNGYNFWQDTNSRGGAIMIEWSGKIFRFNFGRETN